MFLPAFTLLFAFYSLFNFILNSTSLLVGLAYPSASFLLRICLYLFLRLRAAFSHVSRFPSPFQGVSSAFSSFFFLYTGSHLLFHTVSSAVPSASQVLTIVFEMGTGVSPERIATSKHWVLNEVFSSLVRKLFFFFSEVSHELRKKNFL